MKICRHQISIKWTAGEPSKKYHIIGTFAALYSAEVLSRFVSQYKGQNLEMSLPKTADLNQNIGMSSLLASETCLVQ